MNKEVLPNGMYNLYLILKIEDGKIAEGFESLALQIFGERQIIVDGFVVVICADFQEKLDTKFQRLGKRVA